MGSPVGLVLAVIFIVEFERKSINFYAIPVYEIIEMLCKWLNCNY